MKRKYSFLILLLFFSFLFTIINFEIVAEDENNNNNIFSQLENNAPIITLDCSRKSDSVFLGTVHDENFDLDYIRVKVNGKTGSDYTTYVNASTYDFEVDTAIEFEDYSDLTYERHNSISIEAGSLIPSSSPYYSFTENGYGPTVIMTCFFCDDQQCWSSGGGGSNFADTNNIAPFISFYFEDYEPGTPEITYYTDEPIEHIETEDHVKKKEAYYISVVNDEGIVSYVKLIGLMSGTEVKPYGVTRMSPYNFEIAILGIIVSTVAIILIRKRKKK